MSKSNKPSSKTQSLGLGGAKPTGTASTAKAITSAVSKGKAPTGFQGAQVTSTQRMKPTTPIIGANRDQNTNFATVNKDRMKGTIKKLGM